MKHLPDDVAVSKETTGWLYFFTGNGNYLLIITDRIINLSSCFSFDIYHENDILPAEEGLFDLTDRQVLC